MGVAVMTATAKATATATAKVTAGGGGSDDTAIAATAMAMAAMVQVLRHCKNLIKARKVNHQIDKVFCCTYNCLDRILFRQILDGGGSKFGLKKS